MPSQPQPQIDLLFNDPDHYTKSTLARLAMLDEKLADDNPDVAVENRIVWSFEQYYLILDFLEHMARMNSIPLPTTCPSVPNQDRDWTKKHTNKSPEPVQPQRGSPSEAAPIKIWGEGQGHTRTDAGPSRWTGEKTTKDFRQIPSTWHLSDKIDPSACGVELEGDSVIIESGCKGWMRTTRLQGHIPNNPGRLLVDDWEYSADNSPMCARTKGKRKDGRKKKGRAL